jgi:hypothetical protein
MKSVNQESGLEEGGAAPAKEAEVGE